MSTPTPTSNLAISPSIKNITSKSHLDQLHSQLIRLDLLSQNHLVCPLIKFSIHNLPPRHSLKLFHSLPDPDTFLYNTLFANFTHLYTHFIIYSPHLPNNFTFPSLITQIAQTGDVGFGKQVHAHVYKFGFWNDGYATNCLVNMYLSFGMVEEGSRLFRKMEAKDEVTWTTVISRFARLGLVEEARQMFDEMSDRSGVSWNAMIAAYVQANRFKDAFDLFDKMQEEGINLDKFVAASMLSACAALGALDQGQWIHKHIQKTGIKLDPKLATTTIDMYIKCGSLAKGRELFNSLKVKSQSSWNCMIGGLAVHGKGEGAIELFKEMERSKVMPDGITLLNLLTACAHSGLIQEGKHYFEYMVKTYDIEPKMEHYGCLVDMLGRAGLFDEAKKVIDEMMPMDPDAGVLGALLGACKIHKNIELGEQIGYKVIELDPNNSGRYILLANMYASVGRWDDVAKARRLMNDRKVNKERGWSIIEYDGAVNEFISFGRSHRETKEIYEMVDQMLNRIQVDGYEFDNDVDNEERGSSVIYHSEKLAIAYGLLKSKRGDTIRVSKNLRVCRDCHEASKYISKVFDREIIVRDRSRFHHFRNGLCSCDDYW